MLQTGQDSVLQASFFPRKHHPFIGELAEHFDSDYPTGGKTSHPMDFNFQETIWTIINDTLCNYCPLVPDDELLKQVPLQSEVHESNHYGTLSHNAHPSGLFNLGDEMQGFPGLQFLQEFANAYDVEMNGYSLLTYVWRQYNGNNDVITVDHRGFFMFNYKNIMKQCFEQTSGVQFESNMEVLKIKAYAVHLYSSITGHKEYRIS